MMSYQIFVSNINENTDELILMLRNNNPFTPLSNGATITQLLHKILGDLQARLHENRI